MKIIDPSFAILTPLDPKGRWAILSAIESAGRTCYKSEDKIAEESASRFVRDIIQVKHHESVIEHVSISVRFICDRGVSHELVRHRLASFSQESTRYCNYSKGKFGGEITVIRPSFWTDDSKQFRAWRKACQFSEEQYIRLINAGSTPQEARSVLPNSLKTEIVVTANLREWRHIFKLRTAKAAHPQMREVMIPLLIVLRIALPEIFGDIVEN